MDNKASEYSTVLIMFTILAFSSVCLRCFVRFKYAKLWWDDFAAILALIAFMAQCVCDTYGIFHGGVTYHVSDVSMHTYQIGLQTLLVGELTFMASTSLIKVTFCMTLLRVIKRPLFPYIRLTLYIIMAAVVIQEVFFFFYTLFSCRPISYFWEQLDPAKKGHCTSHVMALSYTHGAVVFCADTVLAVLVGYLISNLQLGRTTKIASGLLLGVGSISSIVTLARFFFIRTLRDPDVLYAITDLAILACSEVGVCIIATSAGTLRPLFVRRREKAGHQHLPVIPVRASSEINMDIERMHGAREPTEKIGETFNSIEIRSHTIG